jgi:hypothetical protein
MQNNFYQEPGDSVLRFGDVLQGFVSCTPILNDAPSTDSFRIDVTTKSFVVVLSPCCSISDQVISLATIGEIRNTFLKNQYLADDLTRINDKIPPEKSVPAVGWEKMPAEEKQFRLNIGDAYTFVELFIYAPNEIFPEYMVNTRAGKISMRYYMIDFRHAFRVNCSRIIAPDKSPVDSKCLQLSVENRSKLREKISFYYSRIPSEDLQFIE